MLSKWQKCHYIHTIHHWQRDKFTFESIKRRIVFTQGQWKTVSYDSQSQYFSELECSLSADLARLSYYCRQPEAQCRENRCQLFPFAQRQRLSRTVSVAGWTAYKVRASAHILGCNTRLHALLQIPPDQDRGQTEEQEQPANETRWLKLGC